MLFYLFFVFLTAVGYRLFLTVHIDTDRNCCVFRVNVYLIGFSALRVVKFKEKVFFLLKHLFKRQGIGKLNRSYRSIRSDSINFCYFNSFKVNNSCVAGCVSTHCVENSPDGIGKFLIIIGKRKRR